MTKTVASLCPWPVGIVRPHFIPQSKFNLPAVPKGSTPATIKIEDQTQWEQLLSTMPSRPTTILGEHIAADFVKHTAHDGPWTDPESRPAVWICAGDAPTPEEIAENLAKLKRYCGLVVEYADDLDRRRKMGEARVPAITDRMKEACHFLNLKREWLSDLVDSATTCMFCTATIPAHTVRCPQCKEIVNQARYDELRKQQKEAAANSKS